MFKRQPYDSDGLPLDPSHPWNTPSRSYEVDSIPLSVMFPTGLSQSAIPLTIVCGPPAAGKSTYVDKHRRSDDLVIDLDAIIRESFGTARDVRLRDRISGLRIRNDRLKALATYNGEARAAWFCTTAPLPGTRRKWSAMLRPQRVIVILTPRSECIDRVKRDPERMVIFEIQQSIIDRWWSDYHPWRGDTYTI